MIPHLVTLAQQLPPFGIPLGGPDYGRVLLNALFLLFWVVVAGIAFAIMAPIAMRVFNRVAPGIDEMAELKNGNMAVALVQGATILAMALLVVAVILK
ncbi:MAG: DUF350 domain-containing protein [Armatimonadota bacterium]|nr:DUF350 domain-containing protein [Armatimonadota bacterium]MDR7428324.1 DUF350 domain-containing protein [Armatimonadota bacterium]MDR7465472.1 DUF350 domain-containing protein [Armatimonadota bacterium]MDR7470232.1 DUF350 domain-containing protein [Armatimonadota bacterium]MDR7475584.1 DUF350 domain-containing protein [Armatimonadota bacterium]